MSHKAIFLDRDKTLIEDPGYISDPDQVKLIDGVPGALIELRRMGYKLVVVTNQSAVARGIVTEKRLGKIHDRLRRLLAERDARLDRIYYCPYHPEGVISRYRKESDSRKPRPGMLLAAAKEMDIDLNESWMVGDSARDIEAGYQAGCRTILVEPPSRQKQLEHFEHAPDFRAVNLKEAINVIKKHLRNVREAMEQRERAIKEPAESLPAGDGTAGRTEPQGTNEASDERGRKPEASDTSVASTPPETAREAGEPQAERKRDKQEEVRPVAQKAASEPVREPASPPTVEERSESPSDAMRQDIEENHKTKSDERADSKLSVAHPQSASLPATENERLLQSIVDELKNMQRTDLFGEFSVMRLMAGIVQVLVLFCLVVTVWLLMSPKRQDADTSVFITLGFATVLQLMALTFYMMHGRK